MATREDDIQTLSKAILEMNVLDTGDYGSGAACPFCLKGCMRDAKNVSVIDHELDCPVLIAKDLLAGA